MNKLTILFTDGEPQSVYDIFRKMFPTEEYHRVELAKRNSITIKIYFSQIGYHLPGNIVTIQGERSE